MAKDVFQRKEIKYLMNEEQYQELMMRLDPIAEVDQYGKTQIYNTYFDTPDFKLIRRSLDHPQYKEKLRLRTYGLPDDNSPAFIEIKKKYDGITYKRRIEVSYLEAMDYLWDGILPEDFTFDAPVNANRKPQEYQIQREIDYMLSFYKNMQPMMGIAYDRIAMVGREDPSLRITFDTNLRWSCEDLDLRDGNSGEQLLEPEQHLMEIKISGAMNLEIAHILSELGIFRTSISKYGRGYETFAKQQMQPRDTQNIYVVIDRPAMVRYA